MAKYAIVKLPKELADEMDELKGKSGFRTRTEIANYAIRRFLESCKKEAPA